MGQTGVKSRGRWVRGRVGGFGEPEGRLELCGRLPGPCPGGCLCRAGCGRAFFKRLEVQSPTEKSGNHRDSRLPVFVSADFGLCGVVLRSLASLATAGLGLVTVSATRAVF